MTVCATAPGYLLRWLGRGVLLKFFAGLASDISHQQLFFFLNRISLYILAKWILQNINSALSFEFFRNCSGGSFFLSFPLLISSVWGLLNLWMHSKQFYAFIDFSQLPFCFLFLSVYFYHYFLFSTNFEFNFFMF
jgi:hypothetical protein